MTSNDSKVCLSSLIGPAFWDIHKQLKAGGISELWCKGGRGSLKSTTISEEIFLSLKRDPEGHAFISRRYDNELRDSVFTQMQWSCSMLGLDAEWRFMTSPMQAINNFTEQTILFRGIDNPMKAKSVKAKFGFFKHFWAEEVDQYGGMEELRTVQQSIFRGEGTGQVAFYSFNPPKSARSWVNSEVKIPKPGRVVHHSSYLTVNPAWLGERFIMDAEHLRDTNPMAYKHEYLGEEVGTGLEVFNNIEIRPIPDDEINSFQQIRQGLDFGYAVDPVCFLRMNYDRKKRTLYIFREVSGIGIGNRALNNLVTQNERHTMTLADSAEPKSIDELKLEYNWSVMPAKKGPGSVEHGIKWLCELEKIVIDSVRCPRSAREFVNYALEVSPRGDVISRYPDKDNHCLDATRYAMGSDIYSMSVPSSNIRARARI